MTYQEIKTKLIENKEKIVLGVCFVLVFIVGFGAGKFDGSVKASNYKSPNNYTTSTGKQTTPFVSKEGDDAAKPTVAGAATSTPSLACPVKGNISAKGKKIYHVQGGAFYNRVKPEQCFNTEAEALAAGFVKSSR
jgi:hypothetical protein